MARLTTVVQVSIRDTLQADLNTALKARDEVTLATVRMALTAITREEVAGDAARELSDEEVLTVLGQEAKKRREAAEAYDAANRPELAARERAEGEVLARYLPAPLTDEELATLVRQAITETGADSPRAMGLVMKALQPQVRNRADGKRVSDAVRAALAG